MVLTLCSFVGCAKEPETYPVKGKVVFKGTNKPWPGGTLTFQQVADTGVVATGEIQKDGTFTLTTHFSVRNKAKQKPGAPAGEYKVWVEEAQPQTGPDGQLVIDPIVVGKNYTVEPKENDFLVEALRAGRPGRR
jgi:hypothetical protein